MQYLLTQLFCFAVQSGQHKGDPNLNAEIEPQQLLYTCANEYRYLAQAAALDFKLLEVMTLEAQRDQKLQKKKKKLHSRPFGRTLVSFKLNSKNLTCWICGNVCIKCSSCSFRSLNTLHFFICVIQALSSQITEVNWISESKRTKCVQPLTSFPLSQVMSINVDKLSHSDPPRMPVLMSLYLVPFEIHLACLLVICIYVK